MDEIKETSKYFAEYLLGFLKWVLISALTGAVGGVIGSLFHISVEKVTGFRNAHEWIIVFLPIAGLLIVLLYRAFGLEEKIGTNDILNAVRKKKKGVPTLLAPAIFISTVLTHMFGGSAGREGAALQLGGSIASYVGKLFKVGEKDFPLVLMCGMAAVFSALFATPLTAVFFAMEVISVGIMYYSALVPCLCASLIAYKISLIFGAVPLFYKLNIPAVNLEACFKIAVLAALCAFLSIAFCVVMHTMARYLKMYIRNSYIRIAVGGAAVVLLTVICGTYDYNGAGMGVISDAMAGHARPEAFLLKIIFTALTIGAGYRGGEIVPTFFIGSVFGCTVASLIGVDPGFGAAVGLVAMFCGVVNCPVASIFLALELFGAGGILFFAIACAVSYLMSGYHGLYSGQKIVYSKLRAEYIDIYAK